MTSSLYFNGTIHGDGGNLTNVTAYSYNQDLNTTDSPTFAGLHLDGNLDMDGNDINNAFTIECENQEMVTHMGVIVFYL